MEFEEVMPICIDGEITQAKSIDFSIAPKSFNFVIPKGCKFRFPEENN
jgi:diacylglycerol kinase family enzyme